MRTAFWLVAARLTLGGAGAGPSAEPEPPASSFIPTQGTDGFAYTPVAREVSAYRRNLAAAGKLGT